MNDKKIVFCDLDGTLLNDKKEVTPATRQVLGDLVAAGNYFVISTGRSIVSAKKICDKYGFNWDNFYLSCFNGGLIYDPNKDKILNRIVMDMEDVPIIFDMADKAGIASQTYSDEYVITGHDTEGFRKFLEVEYDPFIIADNIMDAIPYAPCKIFFIELYDREALEAFRQVLEKRFAGKYYCIYSDYCYLEILPLSSGKGTGVRKLSKILDIPIENTLAAGDEENDVSMIEAAGVGVAMLNGSKRAKAAADIITKKDNNNDGLVDVIREFCGT